MAAMDRVTQAGWSKSPSGLSPLTAPWVASEDHGPPTDLESDQRFSAEGSQYWVVAFIAGLVALWVLRKSSGYLKNSTIAVSAFNFMAVFLMAALGFLLVKVVLSIVPVPGLTALAHAL